MYFRQDTNMQSFKKILEMSFPDHFDDYRDLLSNTPRFIANHWKDKRDVIMRNSDVILILMTSVFICMMLDGVKSCCHVINLRNTCKRINYSDRLY